MLNFQKALIFKMASKSFLFNYLKIQSLYFLVTNYYNI